MGRSGIRRKEFRVTPGQKLDLNKIDPSDTSFFEGGKQGARDITEKLSMRLEELQEVLYAEQKHKILIVLQAMDTGGKDGTIRHVFERVNPQGVKVVNFRRPSTIESQHDYLWRIHQQVPSNGEIAIFNRSHYEDVVVVAVHKQISEKELERRYKQILDFERYLCETGTTILKFYLHIDADEQKRRLLDRLKDPKKQWKFNINDLSERDFWSDYMEYYEDAIEMTSTSFAPWYVIPSNHNWFRDLVVSQIIVKEMEKLNLQYPKLRQDPKTIVIR